MGLIQRGVIFFAGTISNAVLFVVLARIVVPYFSDGSAFGVPAGPATDALTLLPTALQLVIGALQLGLILYFVGGLGEERAARRRPL